MLRKTIVLVLTALLMLSCSVPALAAGSRPDTGSITITMADATDKTPIVGAQLDLYRVASLTIDPGDNMYYSYTDEFRSCGYELTDTNLANLLAAFVEGKGIQATQLVTDSSGKALADALPLGLYLVKQTAAVNGYAPCKPFLVSVPALIENALVYDVQAAPKTDIEKLTSINIKKVWNVDRHSSVPSSVTVALHDNGNLVGTFTLNAANNWQVSLANLPLSDSYSVTEQNVPKGFTATYSKSGDTFIVTNTSTLAQTGQLIWPIPILATLGMLLLALGFVILRKPGKSDA